MDRITGMSASSMFSTLLIILLPDSCQEARKGILYREKTRFKPSAKAAPLVPKGGSRGIYRRLSSTHIRS